MTKITEEQKNEVEKIIKRNEKIYNYRTGQWELQHINNIFGEEGDYEKGELYVPSYQRQYVWDYKTKCKFIESLFLNIPIPYVFINEDPNEGCLEVIDGYQRMRTVCEFINGNLKLKNLDKLSLLEGFKFDDLPSVRQRLFKRISMNVVIFEDLDIQQKQEMFARINTTSNKLNSIEVRKGTLGGELYSFLKKLSHLDLFKELCPLSPGKLKREENVELVLRYFAYTEKFSNYNGKVEDFLTEYMKEKSILIDEIIDLEKKDSDDLKELIDMKKKEKDKIFTEMTTDFIRMLEYVKHNLKYGFRKSGKMSIVSSRAYYESVAVGVGLALKEREAKDLNIKNLIKVMGTSNYSDVVSSDGANTVSKFQGRILIVKDALLFSNLDK